MEAEENQYLAPYLRFGGDCREAMKFYHNAFGGELHLQTFHEAGYTEVDHPEHVMHCQLISPDGFTFMGTDGLGEELIYGTNISLSIVTSDKGRGYQLFEYLSKGGQVDLNLEETAWGAEFRALTDRYGINWMFNIG